MNSMLDPPSSSPGLDTTILAAWFSCSPIPILAWLTGLLATLEVGGIEGLMVGSICGLSVPVLWIAWHWRR